MDTKKVENFYNILYNSAQLIKNDLGSTFIEALVETGENLVDDGEVHVENNLPKPETVKQLKDMYEPLELSSLTLDERKQAAQLILIKAAKEDLLQPNHQPTPDAIGVLFSYLIDLFYGENKSLHMADLSIGTGNLVYTIFTTLFKDQEDVSLTGVDNDDLLLSLASTFSALLEVPIELMHQDALQPLLMDPADIMVSDLPIGYYPREVEEDEFKTAFDEGYSYSHFLLIEQGLNYLKDGAYAFYLLPTSTFESEDVKGLLSFVQKTAHIQSIIHLPKEWFQNEESRKSIFVMQKKGEQTKQVDEVLIANAPSINDKKKFEEFVMDIKNWKIEQGIS